MTTIAFLVDGDRVEGAMFYAVPIEKRLDFHCIPPDLLTYPELEAISRQLASKTTSGQVREYRWEEVP
jgi:hypothetical protein